MNDAADHEESDAAQGYVAGTLGPEETAAFERHLLTCAACRDEVRQGAAISASMRGVAERAPAAGGERRGRRPTVWKAPVFAGLGLAAAVVLLVTSRDDDAARLARLYTPPPFEAMPVRAPLTELDVLVDGAMAAYATGDYGRARERFARIPAGELTTGARFYFGAAALADGRASAAREPLARVVADSLSPFAAPARVLLAKALLHGGLADSALATVAVSRDAAARAFADSIRTLLRPSRR
jgi:hypothetical protein